MPGTVDKIIPSPRPSQPEKAQIAVDGADQRHRDLRFENILTDEHGDDVKLKKGAHVEVTVTAEPKAWTGNIGENRRLFICSEQNTSTFVALRSAGLWYAVLIDPFFVPEKLWRWGVGRVCSPFAHETVHDWSVVLSGLFEIFRRQTDGNLYWVEAEQNLEAAKARAQLFIETLTGDYVIVDNTTGEKFSIGSGGTKPN
jgi:hypothetical protein